MDIQPLSIDHLRRIEQYACDMKKEKELINSRINLLQTFLGALDNLNTGFEPGEAAKSYINRNLVAVRQAVVDAGCFSRITLGAPAAVGGSISRDLDPFEMIFVDWYGESLVPRVREVVERTLGVYEHLRDETGLVQLPIDAEGIDIESAIRRALRPVFDKREPESERVVQDAVATILRSIGIDFSREQETAPVGPRAFRPDIVMDKLNLAIEIKLAKQSHSASKIQEEVAADVAAYKTKWKRILFVIYDCGAITDPDRLQKENMKLFGVTILLVKH